MFKLTDEDLAEFQRICREIGITLTDAEVRVEANNLIRLYRILLRPTPSEVEARVDRERAERLTLLKDPVSREAIRLLKRRPEWRRGSNVVRPPLNW